MWGLCGIRGRMLMLFLFFVFCLLFFCFLWFGFLGSGGSVASVFGMGACGVCLLVEWVVGLGFACRFSGCPYCFLFFFLAGGAVYSVLSVYVLFCLFRLIYTLNLLD